MILDEGGLGLEHQARHIHARRTFGLAELAMDAEAGLRLNSSLPQSLGSTCPVAICRTRLAWERGVAASRR